MTDEIQRNPDLLLAAIQNEESRRGRGQLKVFLGMCPGVGKTYAMLEAAQRELKAKRDMVIGYVETHGRKETDALAQGIPTIPRRTIEYRGVMLSEMDLDAVLVRRPQLAVVDELAHTNAPGSRHPKRWQDVQELLDAGIDVFTTLNVQHVESRADTVRQITGAEIRETVSDSVLDKAVLELVDLPPAELVQRLHEGKVYLLDRAATAAQNFFREGNLTALRELALRLVADHVGEDTVQFRRNEPTTRPWKTGNRLLVAVGPSPLSEPLIRWTRRMADELRCPWLAVHAEGSRPLPEAAQTRLQRNLDTARELGAEVIATTDEDVASGLLRIARERNVTQIVFGKPAGVGLFHWLRSGRLLRRLMQESGDIDVLAIRAEKALADGEKARWRPRKVKPVEPGHPQAVMAERSCLWGRVLVQFEPMNWKRMLACVTGSVDEALLARNEYLVTENRILRNQIRGRIRLTDPERISLASAAKRLGRKALEEVAQIVRPETILGWHRRLIDKKFDGSKNRSPGKGGSTRNQIEELVLQLARENRSWGYRRIAGALSNLGHDVSHQTVANVLKRYDVAPAPERGRTMSWPEFIRSHMEVLAAVDFFTAEVWTAAGLITHYVMTFMRVSSRAVCIAGITTSPDKFWMEQMARNISLAEVGFLNGCRYLLHDRDTKFCAAFSEILEAVGIQGVKLPPRSPNLNAHLERWHRSVKDECLAKMIFFGEASLRQALSNYVLHFHGERNHQGKGNAILFPTPEDRIGESTGKIQIRERLGGMLKFYYREAA